MNIELSSLKASGLGGMVVENDVLALNWVKASPAARKAAKENSLDLSSVTPSGPDGRIIERDVQGALEKTGKPPKISPLAAKVALEQGVQLASIKADGRIMKEDVRAAAHSGTIKPLPIVGMRKVIADRMSLSWQSAPHVHLTVEVDMTAAIGLKDKFAAATGQKTSITEIVVKCAAQALRENPVVNARIAENQIVFSDEVNIGVAVALDNGLIVPVIRGADRKSIREIRETVVDFGKRARSGQLTPDEITGGTFTVTNLGMFGTDHFTPVINPPESAILGVCRTVEKPVVFHGAIVIRPMCNFILGFDHRIIDGAVGAQFMSRLRDLIENPALLLID
jgi:pyruvate dehydrogenase E2 component (dihydrolipoamide acetyltransferase)